MRDVDGEATATLQRRHERRGLLRRDLPGRPDGAALKVAVDRLTQGQRVAGVSVEVDVEASAGGRVTGRR